MINSVAFVDWISYTVPNTGTVYPVGTEFFGCSVAVVQEVQTLLDVSKDGYVAWLPVKANRPFQWAVQEPQTGTRIEYGGGSDRVLVSYPGKACKHITMSRRIGDVLGKHSGGMTRIDVSMDIESALTPIDFIAKRDKNRHKVGAHMFSPEGQTCYVGSWSSDRFARVYRYNPPHEREKFLRIEHVFKGKQARAMSMALVKVAPIELMKSVGEIYGWIHEQWIEALQWAKSPYDVAWYKEERHVSKTLKWLEEQCVPAIVRLVNEGEIVDIDQWINDNIYAMIVSSSDEVVTNAVTREG